MFDSHQILGKMRMNQNLAELDEMSNAAATVESLAPFLTESKSVSTLMKQTYFEVLPREKGKGMFICNCRQS